MKHNLVLLGCAANGVIAIAWWLIDKQSWLDSGWTVAAVSGLALLGYAGNTRESR